MQEIVELTRDMDQKKGKLGSTGTSPDLFYSSSPEPLEETDSFYPSSRMRRRVNRSAKSRGLCGSDLEIKRDPDGAASETDGEESDMVPINPWHDLEPDESDDEEVRECLLKCISSQALKSRPFKSVRFSHHRWRCYLYRQKYFLRGFSVI